MHRRQGARRADPGSHASAKAAGYPECRPRPRLLLPATLLGLSILAAGKPSADPAALCDAAALRAADRTGVPASVLRAITRVETGRQRSGDIRPWPWAVNLAGEGRWLGSAGEALGILQRHHAAGARNFDVGCFQINYRWHGHAFDSLSEMLDPQAGADYAAGFLKRLHTETGDWRAAAGAYHSRTERHAAPYRRRFDRMLSRLRPAPATPAPVTAAPPRTAVPPSAPAPAARRLGSLFPLGAGRRPRLIAFD